MNYSNKQMKYAFLLGYMSCYKQDNGLEVSFEDFIDKANEKIDELKIKINFGEFEELMGLFNGSGYYTRKVDGVEYIIVTDDVDGLDDSDLYGIVFMKDWEWKIDTVSFEEFNELTDDTVCDCCLGSWTEFETDDGICECYCSKCSKLLSECKHKCRD